MSGSSRREIETAGGNNVMSSVIISDKLKKKLNSMV
jgi:hypothetical protein